MLVPKIYKKDRINPLYQCKLITPTPPLFNLKCCNKEQDNLEVYIQEMGGKYNHPFIAAVCNSEITNYFIAKGGKIFYLDMSLAKIILNLIVYNNLYPRHTYAPLILIQRFMMNIQDTQKVPNSVIVMITDLNRMKKD